jgi:hypothetical protein
MLALGLNGLPGVVLGLGLGLWLDLGDFNGGKIK